MVEITPKTRLFDLLQEFPVLEEKIMAMAPVFKNLKNVAEMGNLEALELINRLRADVGLPKIERLDYSSAQPIPSVDANDPDWVQGTPQFVVYAEDLLMRGEVPVQRVFELLPQLEDGRTLLLISSFEPTPMIDALKKQGKQVYHKINPDDPRQHLVYVSKNPENASDHLTR